VSCVIDYCSKGHFKIACHSEANGRGICFLVCQKKQIKIACHSEANGRGICFLDCQKNRFLAMLGMTILALSFCNTQRNLLLGLPKKQIPRYARNDNFGIVILQYAQSPLEHLAAGRDHRIIPQPACLARQLSGASLLANNTVREQAPSYKA
jgi:hypothetical protein